MRLRINAKKITKTAELINEMQEEYKNRDIEIPIQLKMIAIYMNSYIREIKETNNIK